MPPPSGSKSRSDWYRYSGLGLQFAATIGVFGAVGFWLDGKWGTGPWLLIAFVFLGFFGGLISLVSRVTRLGRPAAPPTRDEGDADGP